MKNVVLFLLLIVCTFIMTSCNDQRHWQASLDAADSMVDERPDSALTILDSLERHSGDFSKPTEMRWRLLRLKAQNKCDTVFRSDSLQRILVNYYDKHGTPNERMISHYLLGRARSDMGEAPEAMRSYQEAVSRADTTSVDCDWWNLSRIFLQLADEYYGSYMPMEMKGALRLSRSCALHAGDAITSIIAYSRLSEVYELLGSSDSAGIVIREAANMFKNHKRDDWASQTLSLLIEDEVEKGNVEEAKRIVKYYEGYSGFFDERHEIEEGREIYYYSKGIYYLGIGSTDSAEWVFRKLLRQAQDMNDTHAAYLGLRKKYLITGPKDSLVKYSILSENSNDSLYQEHYKANVQQLQERFNYSRHVENEQQLMLSSERKDKIMLASFFAFIAFSVTIVALYHNKRRKREALLREYREDIERLRKLKSEMAGLVQSKEVTIVKLSQESVMKQSDIEDMKGYILDLTEKLDEARRLSSEAISAKDDEIRRLTIKYKKYDKFFENQTRDDIVKTIQRSDIVRKLQFDVRHPLQKPSNDDWEKLDRLFHEIHPNFPETLQNTYHLSVNEYRLCQLVFAGISPKGIAVLMGYDKSNVTNMRKRMLAKLIGVNGKASDFDKFLFSIPLL
ncbi:MAG: hypothetical protein IKR05_11435 [Prevotella sp.]|nr:hypothetical protein [Prevotella sp.]